MADEVKPPVTSMAGWRDWPRTVWRWLARADGRQPAQPEPKNLHPAQGEPNFQQFFKHSPDAIFLIDPHSANPVWRIVDCSDAAGAAHGYARADLLGRSIDLLNPQPSRRDEGAAALERLQVEQAQRYEGRRRRQDGSEFPVEGSQRLISLSGRELVLRIERDVTEQRQAEERLWESQALQRALFDDSPTSLWEEDFSAVKERLDGLKRQGVTDFEAYLSQHPEIVAECMPLAKVTNVNEATMRLYRAASKTDLLHGLERVVSANALSSFRQELVHIAEGHWPFEWESTDQTVTGEALDISLRCWVVAGYEDTLARVMVSVTDITERKRIEAALLDSEAVFRTSFEHSPVGIALMSPEGEYLRINRRMHEMLGYSEAEMIGHKSSEFNHPDDNPSSQAQAQRLVNGEIQVADIDKRYLHRSGRVIWTQRTMASLRVGSTGPRYFISMVHDISERVRAEEELQASNAQLTTWLAELEERTRGMETLNEMVSLFQTCRSPEEAYEVVGKLAPALFPGAGGSLCIVPPSRNMVETMVTWGDPAYALNVFQLDDCWALRRGQPHVVLDGHTGLTCRHMAAVPAAYICVPLFDQGEVLGCLHLNTPAGQLSVRKQQFAKTVADAIALSVANLRLRESLRQQSIIDVMTGLFNRRYMEETLEREVRRSARAQRPLSIVMLDLDHFKRFNDTQGHAAGDILLNELGAFLLAHVRAEDIACRYGGEEFTLIMPDSSLQSTAQRAEILCAGIRSLRAEYRGEVIGPVTASLGVATFPEHGATGALVLRAADEALYRAKHEGRNRVALAALPAAAGTGTGRLEAGSGEPASSLS